ncbi:MAG: 1-acyl-sn-glycerol-3-phosphate acyltransferase [Bacteroidetes bacterium]|nr:1-acyl-sn-glycerol-3-phosphate acyltransferase [Bacteroidota bacterium]
MEAKHISLDAFYESLKDILTPPLKHLEKEPEEPIILIAVKELSYWLSKALGWTFKGEVPKDVTHAVVIVAPHTSTWDFVFGMAAYRYFKEVKGYYLAKKELFSGPLKFLYSKTGGIPVDRSANNNLVVQVAKLFEEKSSFYLALAPEGTRSKTKTWKSGFYRIALEANVPIIMAYLDYGKKEAGVGEVLYPTGNFKEDAKKIEDFYKTITPKNKDNWSWKVL